MRTSTSALLTLLFCVSTGCNDPFASTGGSGISRASCQFVPSGFGPTGNVPVHADQVITGLEVPWALAFLPNGDWLVTERVGRVRLVRGGALVPVPVVTVNVATGGEQGLLGLALDPQFASNSRFYVYNTVAESGTNTNRVDRYVLSADHARATFDRTIVDGIPAGIVHNGGRIKFGPDGNLYIGTGDSLSSPLAQDPGSLAGKILRVTAEGGVPSDNPSSGKDFYVRGVRNIQAFDFVGAGTLIVAEHGPTGEINGWTGHDRVEFAGAGDNFGWPTTYGCGGEGFATPALSWNDAVPPGGGVLYTGGKIPEWTGSFLIGTLGSTHLHRVAFSTNPYGVTTEEVYFPGDFGRLRDVETGPDGYLYVTTSNCDGRGNCPAERDSILKISRS